jgi:hypothetical protein
MLWYSLIDAIDAPSGQECGGCLSHDALRVRQKRSVKYLLLSLLWARLMYLPSSAPWPLYMPNLLAEPLFSTSCVQTPRTVRVPDSPLCALAMIPSARCAPILHLFGHRFLLCVVQPPPDMITHTTGTPPQASVAPDTYRSSTREESFVEEPSTHEHGSEATTLPPLSPAPPLSPPAIRVVAISNLIHVSLALARRHPYVFLTITVPRFCGPSAGCLSPQLRLHSHPPAAFLVVTRIIVAVPDPTRSIGRPRHHLPA